MWVAPSMWKTRMECAGTGAKMRALSPKQRLTMSSTSCRRYWGVAVHCGKCEVADGPRRDTDGPEYKQEWLDCQDVQDSFVQIWESGVIKKGSEFIGDKSKGAGAAYPSLEMLQEVWKGVKGAGSWQRYLSLIVRPSITASSWPRASRTCWTAFLSSEYSGGEEAEGKDPDAGQASSAAAPAKNAKRTDTAAPPSAGEAAVAPASVVEGEAAHAFEEAIASAESPANFRQSRANESAAVNSDESGTPAPAPALEARQPANCAPAPAPAPVEPDSGTAPAAAPDEAVPAAAQQQVMPTEDSAADVAAGGVLSVLLGGREHHTGEVCLCRSALCMPNLRDSIVSLYIQVISVKINTSGDDGTPAVKEFRAEAMWDDGSDNADICLYGAHDAVQWKKLAKPHLLLVRNHIAKCKQNTFRGPLSSLLNQQAVLGPPPPSSVYGLLLDKGVETISDKDLTASF
eukprot:3974225-Pleurochrysis_carterae.AAC.1